METKQEAKDLGGFFAVSPKYDCPHISDHLVEDPQFFQEVSLKNPCGDCQNIGENWVCLKCKTVKCSRYVNEHMLFHAVESGHALVLSFSDLSFWCYHCESYVSSPEFTPVLKHFQTLKFGSEADEISKQLSGLTIEEEDTAFNLKTVEELATKLKEGVFTKVAVMAGAGISVNAGIPDFRSEKGLYAKFAKEELPQPEAIFDISFFKKKPEFFFQFAKEFSPEGYEPTLTHYFLSFLAQKDLLHMCYSQNIDGLEKKAGVPSDKLVQAHGHLETAHCSECGKEFDTAEMKTCISSGEVAWCSCGSPAKPDIVFFGEALPPSFHSGVAKLDEADLLVIVGTSLVVYPFAALADMVPKKCPRVYLSKDLSKSVSSSFKFKKKADKRDVALIGDCDEILGQVLDICEWRQEFEEFVASHKST